MLSILLTLACGSADIEFQDLTEEGTEATTSGEPGAEGTEGAEGTQTVTVTNEDGTTTEVVVTAENADGSEKVVIGGEQGVVGEAGAGTGAHATVGGEKGVDLGAGGERGGAQVDVAEGAFQAEAGGGEEFKVQIGKNNEVGIQGKTLKVGDKKVSWGDKKE
jgi:hypothetical protein